MHLLGLNFAKIHQEVGAKSSMSPIPSLLLSLFCARTRQGETPSTCHSSDHHVHHTAQRVGNYKPTAIAVHPVSWSGIFQLGVLYLPKKIGVQNWTYNILKNSPSSCLAYNLGVLSYAKTSWAPKRELHHKWVPVEYVCICHVYTSFKNYSNILQKSGRIVWFDYHVYLGLHLTDQYFHNYMYILYSNLKICSL